MPRKVIEYSIPFSPRAVMEILSDPAAVGECLAFVRRTDGNRWIIRSPMDSISGTRHLDADVKAGDAWVEFEARGETLLISGRFDLEPAGEGGTSLKARVGIEGRERMAAILNPIIGAQLGSQIKAFLRAVEQKLVDGDGHQSDA